MHETEKNLNHLAHLTHSVTVVLPSYNEQENASRLMKEFIEADQKNLVKRFIWVDDDSPDGTSEFIKNTPFERETLCIHRINRHGLSSAVLEGVMLADTEYVAVMDADCQHDPRDLISMILLANNKGLDLIIGSRFKNNAKNDSHTGLRAVMSQVGNKISALVLRRDISDPLTGYFLIKRKVVLEIIRDLQPAGYKILLEILFCLREKDCNIEEIQINFRPRLLGESKLDISIILNFIEQLLIHLTKGIFPQGFLGFIIVGSTGVVVHILSLYLTFLFLHISFLMSQTIATLCAMLWNYTLNNRFTFKRSRKSGSDWLIGLALFVTASSFGAIANVGMAGFLNGQEYNWLIAGVAGIIVGTVFNFAISKTVVWRN